MKKIDITYSKQIPYAWNHTEKNFINKTIHELFETQVRETPNNTAVIFNNTKLTYVEPKKRSWIIKYHHQLAKFSHPYRVKILYLC